MPEIVYVGTYTANAGGRGRGIHVFQRDAGSGMLTPAGEPVLVDDPSFLAVSPRLPVLYAVEERDDGAVRALAIAPDGGLHDLGARPVGGSAPCHLLVTPDARYVIVAHYGSGSVSVHALADDGSLGERTDLVKFDGSGPDPERQQAAHAHHVSLAGDNHVRVVDLGSDAIRELTLDPGNGRLQPRRVNRLRPGTGPRHLAKHPDGRLLVSAELESSVLALSVAADGALTEIATQPATIEPPARRNLPSEIAVSADGRFAYVANRGAGTITTFDVARGAMQPVAERSVHGRWPRHFALIGGNLYAANEDSHAISVFRVDPETGIPQVLHELEVASPACIVAAQV